MSIFKSVSVCLAFVAAALTPSAAAAQTPSVYWGAYLDGAPFDPSIIDRFEADAGRKESIVFWGEPWQINGAMQPFQTVEFETVRSRGSIPMIGWNSWGSTNINDPNWSLAKVYDGTYDAYITSWAQSARAWGHPFFIRFDHEMNGWWYPWSEQKNGNHAGDYVKAWRHVVNIFRSVGATNATWVWTVNTTSDVATPLPDLYPGDSYVDWTAMDGYNWGTDHGFQWFWFDQIFGVNPWSKHNTYTDILAVAPTKPIMIAETATSKNGGDPSAWIKDTMLTQLPQKYTQVKALLWFNWNANDPTLSWPIESTSLQQSAFRESVNSGYYASNTFGSLPASAIKPLSQPTQAPPPPPTPPPPTSGSGSGTVTLPDIGDSYINAAQPSSTAGGPSHTLIADGSPYCIAYLRFDLSGLAGKTIISAALRVHTSGDAGAGSNASFAILRVSDDSWNGATLTYANAPHTSTQLGTLTSPARDLTWYQTSLSPAGMQGDVGSLLSIAVKPSSDNADGVIIDSREAGAATTAQLVVSYR